MYCQGQDSESSLLLLSSLQSKVSEVFTPSSFTPVSVGGSNDHVLTRGQYRILFSGSWAEQFVDDLNIVTFREKQIDLNHVDPDSGEIRGTELKRIHIFKMDVMPPDADGVSRATAVIRVLDNPLPLIGVVAGLAAIVGGAVTWVSVDGFDTFAEEAAGFAQQIALVGLVLLGGYLIIVGE